MTSNSKKKRSAVVKRKTNETDIVVEINLDGSGKSEISTRISFFNHILELFTRHSGIDLKLNAEGDLVHHLIEDIGISMGKAILKALGDKKGIKRFGDKTLPMDEALATCALDLSGRSYHHIDLKIAGIIEDMESENLVHFFESLAINAKINLHIFVHYGSNEHHKAEAAIKSMAYAFKEAIELKGDQIPSTKGVL
jgi:imidazoleglycerol-phosphate dehydratase